MPDAKLKVDRPTLSRDWDVSEHCSDACRGTQSGDRDTELEAAILTLLAERGRDKTICPSEAAKLVSAAAADDFEKARGNVHPRRQAWEPLMEPARAAARRLVAQGKILMTQHGHAVDPSTAKGPIRLKLR